ncbi:MAG: DNA adenine methylase [Acetobacter syzygii]|uniref:DNA adenine methylase n=1 Tax=Acetobacter syzygii TaxID=146476 RepID=UPI0039EB3263
MDNMKESFSGQQNDFINCAPVLPVAPYLGGKRILSKKIVPLLRSIPHRAYVEPFVGMGGVFFRRNFVSYCEVINDLNGDVANLFRILKWHYVPLMDILRWQLTSREDFERLRQSDRNTLTDLHKAARFLYLQRLAFGGKPNGAFGVNVNPARFDVCKLGQILDEVHQRLSRVVVECLPYADVINRYDRSDTLFYLDPPYYGNEKNYNAPFSKEDYVALAVQLENIKGRFVMSLNDHPEVRKIFSMFHIESVEVNYSISGLKKGRGRRGEVIITK